MPFSWLLWWWFLSSLKRKIKSYQGEECKHKSSLSRWDGVGGSREGCRALSVDRQRQSFSQSSPSPSCAQSGHAHVLMTAQQ